MSAYDFPGSFRDANDIRWSLLETEGRYRATFEHPDRDDIESLPFFDSLPELLRGIADAIEKDYAIELCWTRPTGGTAP